MKQTIFIILNFIITGLLQAQVSKTVNVAAGGLSTTLNATELITVTDLTVTGAMDARDFKTIRDEMPNLAQLNISSVNIKAYYGLGGTYAYESSFSYRANIVPEYSFFNTNTYTGKTTLKTIILPNSATSIGESAFYGCNGLNSLTIPDAVDSIKLSAFRYCTGLAKIIIGNSFPTIGVQAFLGCTGLLEFEVKTENPNYSTLNGVLFNKNQSNLIQYPTGKHGIYTIPNSVTTIGNSAFQDCVGLTSISIPNSVTQIGNWAFPNCIGLTSIIIPNSVDSIGTYAFRECDGLNSVIISNSIRYIGEQTFYSCSNLTNIMIPNSVNLIGASAFGDCRKLISVTIGNSVTTIGNGAFDSCMEMDKITIPNSVISIGQMAFSNCRKLNNVIIPNSVDTIRMFAFYGCTALNDITIGNSVKSVEPEAFRDCIGLINITIPNSVTSIGTSAFYGCLNLSRFDIQSENPNYSSFDGVIFNKDKTILVLYPEGKQGDYNIPNTVISIKDYAFQHCIGLTNITIPNSVDSIKSGTFAYCSGLTEVFIPNYVTSLGNAVFFSCTGLTSATISASVKSIGSQAFQNCIGLTSIYAYSTIPADLSSVIYVFKNVNKSACTLYVPVDSKIAYQSADTWKDFTNIVETNITPSANLVTELSNNTFKIYPNPTSGVITIEGLDTNQQNRISVYSLAGKLIKSITSSSFTEVIDVSCHESGTYLLDLNNQTFKIVKE